MKRDIKDQKKRQRERVEQKNVDTLLDLFERHFVVPLFELWPAEHGNMEAEIREVLPFAQWLWNYALMRVYAPESAAKMSGIMAGRLCGPPLHLRPAVAMNVLEVHTALWLVHCVGFPLIIRNATVNPRGDGFSIALEVSDFLPSATDPAPAESPADPAAPAVVTPSDPAPAAPPPTPPAAQPIAGSEPDAGR